VTDIFHSAMVNDIHQEIFVAKLPTAEGAVFDHLANQVDDTTCHPDTRVALIEEVMKWVDDPSGDSIFWLQGRAGTGKSTISRTVAHQLAKRGVLGASFFFKRGEGDRGNATRFYTTIAVQLIRRLPSLVRHVRSAIEADPDIGKKFLEAQFRELILKPLRELDGDPHTTPQTFVVVVDALDECDPEEHATRIIGQLPQKPLSSVRLKFFVTSRPEFPIRREFDKIKGTFKDLALHNVDQFTIKHDMLTYITSMLRKVREDINSDPERSQALPPEWPGRERLDILVDMAVPLFIFAATMCRFIGDLYWDPEEQLQKIIVHKTKSLESESDFETTYRPVLDQMLVKRSGSGVEPRVPKEREIIKDEFQRVIGPIVLLADPLPVKSLACLLGEPRNVIERRLRSLHSVLDIPSDPDAPVKLLHLSFRDFLVQKDKKNAFHVDEATTHESLANKCLDLLSSSLKEDICNLQEPGKQRSEVDEGTILRCIPPEVQYACLYWVYHVKGGIRRLHDGSQAQRFLERNFLPWLEALSLLGRISDGVRLIDELQGATDVSKLLNGISKR
jgi:hypothetical protein